MESKKENKLVIAVNVDDKYTLHIELPSVDFGIYAYNEKGEKVNCWAGKIYNGKFKHELYKDKVKISGVTRFKIEPKE